MNPKLYYDPDDPHLPVEVYGGGELVARFYCYHGRHYERLKVARSKADRFIAATWAYSGFWPMLVEFVHRLAVYYEWKRLEKLAVWWMRRR